MLCEFLWPKKRCCTLSSVDCRPLHIPLIFSHFIPSASNIDIYIFFGCYFCGYTVTRQFHLHLWSFRWKQRSDGHIPKAHRVHLIVGSWFDWFVHPIRTILIIISTSNKPVSMSYNVDSVAVLFTADYVLAAVRIIPSDLAIGRIAYIIRLWDNGWTWFAIIEFGGKCASLYLNLGVINLHVTFLYQCRERELFIKC